MITAGPVVALLLSLAPCYVEPPAVERLTMIGESIAAVSATVSDAAGLLAIGKFESAWCESVHSGARKGGHGAGLWQIEPGSRRHPPFAGLSREATEHAAGEALWLWRHSWQCGSSPAARFRAYAGLPCDSSWAGAAPRARFYSWAVMNLSHSGAY